MYKVLVVDDEVPIRQWLEFCIKKLGEYEVVGTGANGAEGYSLFRKTNPDIVITDIRMPGMDGLEMIEMIQEINPAVYVLVLTSHEEFSYARRAIQAGIKDYILKTEISEESLKKILEKGTQTLEGYQKQESEVQVTEMVERDKYLRSLVLSERNGEIGQAQLRQYGVDFLSHSYVVLDVKSAEKGKRFGLEETESMERIHKIYVDMEHTVLIIVFDKQSSVSSSRQEEVCMELCSKILNQGDFCIGISGIWDSPYKIGSALRQAYESSFQGFYHKKQKVFKAEQNVKQKPEKGENYKIRFSKELLNQNYEKVVQIKENMKEAIKAETPLDVNAVKELYIFFMVTLLHFVKEDVEKLEIRIQDLRKKTEECENIEKLNVLIDTVFDDSLKVKGNQELSYAVRTAIAYMEENYSEQLTLSEVAGYVALSAEYLSRIFKEETGIKFVVYLNNIRLKHALQLLESTNLKVYEIAEQVGYSNLSYFSTVFKKNFGQNPFEYKKHLREKEH